MKKLQSAIENFCRNTDSNYTFYDLKVPVIQVAFLKNIGDLIDIPFLNDVETVAQLNKYVSDVTELKTLEIDLFKESDLPFLKDSIKLFSEFDFSFGSEYFEQDVISHIYETMSAYFITGSAHKGFAEYITPASICNVISKITGGPKLDGDSIYDPCCGTGALIIPILRDNYDKHLRVFAQDINQESTKICKMNVFLQHLRNKIKQIQEISLKNGEKPQSYS